MSDINLQITPDVNPIQVTVEQNTITVEPEAVNLTFSTTGISGTSGFSGLSGATGATGEQGISGFSGLSGFSGNSGATGISGMSGFSGDPGGATGATGFSGISGFSGMSGFSGDPGGATGATGATGPIGGSNTQVIFNDAGVANGSANLTFNKTTNTLVGVQANISNINIANIFNLGSGTERVTLSNTAANTSINFDVIANAILYQNANAVSNVSINVRGNSTIALSSILDVSQSTTITFINTNGSTAYGVTNINIDGSNANVVNLWSGSTGNGFPATINGKDMYTFNIIRTSNTAYTVMGTRVGFV